MASRGKRPLLYEFLDSRESASQMVPQTALRRGHMARPPAQDNAGVSDPAPLAEPKIVPRPVRDEGGFPLAPGKSVRVPSGYLFFGAAMMVALLIGVFALGYARGERNAVLRLAADPRANGTPDIVEPLQSTPGGGAAPVGTGGATTGPSTTRPSATTPVRQRPGPGVQPRLPVRSAGGALLIESGSIDPRTPGENYLFVARRGPEEALRIAEFLAGNGVPAGVIPTSNPAFRQVVALQGFTAEAMRTNDFQRYRQNIRDLGREWATRNRGSQNFDDVYSVRYDP